MFMAKWQSYCMLKNVNWFFTSVVHVHMYIGVCIPTLDSGAEGILNGVKGWEGILAFWSSDPNTKTTFLSDYSFLEFLHVLRNLQFDNLV